MNDATEPGRVDHREFLDLIREFSEKSRRACDAYYARKTTWSRRLMFGCLAIAFVTVALFLLAVTVNPEAPPVNWQHDGPAIILKLTLLGIMVVAVVYGVWQSWSEISNSRFEILPLTAALEKLVARASQLEDRSIRDADEKVIFDLRIAEAESALEYADWVIGRRSIWRRFSGALSPSSRQYRSRSPSL
jgi:hypothetical protein